MEKALLRHRGALRDGARLGPGGKRWDLECKYRRGGKTLCALYAAPGRMGFMVIFGKDEREKVEGIRGELSESVRRAYDNARTYRDGKWVMFEPTDGSEFGDYLRLLALKRRPNRAASESSAS